MGLSVTGAVGLRRDRKLIALLAVIFGTHMGWYLVLPYFIVVLTRSRGLSAGAAGAVLAANSIAILGASLLGGLLSDRIGRRAAILPSGAGRTCRVDRKHLGQGL